VAALLAVGFILLALIVVAHTMSVNARAGRQDDVVSVPDPQSDAPEFLRAIAAVAGQPVTNGNRVTLLHNGDEIFPPMLAAIAAARSSVHFATFVYERGVVADTFAAAFAAAGARGVEVRVILDRDGAKKASPASIERMCAAGCDVRWFRRAQWFDWEEYNRRMHRKLLIIDGKVGFVGGVGIADQWSGRGDAPNHWRDTHARIDGPAVESLQSTFVDSWNETSGQLLLGTRYFTPPVVAGPTPVVIVQSNPANATSAAQRSYAILVEAARRTLNITNAYFIPEPPFVRALADARRRGVDVTILVPGPYHNKPVVRRASRHTWRVLLEQGVALFEHQVTMVHAKSMIVDDSIVCIGSINFDPRSFALNAECSAVACDVALAAAMRERFLEDLRSARRVTIADLDRCSATTRAMDATLYFFRGQL